jgi:hypothetical protein
MSFDYLERIWHAPYLLAPGHPHIGAVIHLLFWISFACWLSSDNVQEN